VHLVTLGHFRSRDKDNEPRATRKLYGSMFYRTGVIADGNFALGEYGFSTLFASVTLTLTLTR